MYSVTAVSLHLSHLIIHDMSIHNVQMKKTQYITLPMIHVAVTVAADTSSLCSTFLFASVIILTHLR